jgi:membrane-associated phospholipid phosphatase
MVGLFLFDTRIWLAASNLVSQPLYYNLTDFITDYGLFLFYAAFVLIFAYALIKKNRKLIWLLVAYIKTQLIFAFALVRIIKVLVGRARPGHDPEFTFFSFAFRHNSFPSGHSADAFVSGVFLFYLLKHSKYSAGRYLPLIYAFLIAISRVFISSHYPSDVAAGMAIGILGAWFFIARLPR